MWQREVYHLDLDTFAYEPVWQLQKRIVEAKINQSVPDFLLVTEHLPVYTLGRSAHKDHILVERDLLREKEILIYEVERGGDVTWHGPGQMVCYPIFELKNQDQNLHHLYFYWKRLWLGWDLATWS